MFSFFLRLLTIKNKSKTNYLKRNWERELGGKVQYITALNAWFMYEIYVFLFSIVFWGSDLPASYYTQNRRRILWSLEKKTKEILNYY